MSAGACFVGQTHVHSIETANKQALLFTQISSVPFCSPSAHFLHFASHAHALVVMSFDSTGDREARRKARYRGNPERARFHREGSDNEFVITVADGPAPAAAKQTPLVLVNGMRSINISDNSNSNGSMACSNSEGRVWSNNTKSSLRSHSECSGADAAAAQGPSSSSRSSGSPSTIDTGSEPEIGLAEEQDSPEEVEEYVAAPIKAAASSHAQVPSRVHRSRIVESSSSSLSPEEDVYPANRDRQRNAGRAAAQPGRTNAAHESGTLHASSSKTKLPEKPRTQKAAAGSNSRRQKRTKENTNTKEIEQVLGEAPVRMTRSMARKTGVQPTRRYYGEGVSASQIIRPLKPASKGQ